MRLLFCWFLLPAAALAQRPGRELAPVPPSTTVPTPASPTTARAATPAEPLFSTLAHAPERAAPAADTLPDLDFRMYDPARRQPIDWGTLGNLGSAARPLLYETAARRGFDLGFHAFDFYKIQPEELRFYRNSRAFSDAFFSQGRNQFETMASLRFARTFADGLSVALDYRGINNLGQYRYQRDKHNALSFGVWLPLGRRYDGFLIVSKNVVRQQESGGIVSDTVFNGAQFQGPLAAQIWLPEQRARTRLDDRAFQLTQHLKFAGGEAGKRALRASHTLKWSRQTFKFADGSDDADLAEDTVFLRPFLTDLRGLRHFVDLRRLDNSLTLNTFKSKKEGRPSDVLAVGLSHSYFWLDQEPRDSVFSNLFATGDLTLTPSERFNFQARGALGLFANIGEYQLEVALTLRLGKVGELRASLLSQRRPPALLAQQIFVSQRPIWQNNFEKLVENSLSATYALPAIGLALTARTHLTNNYIYFDQNSQAAQTTAPLQVLQLLVHENFRLGSLRFDNTLALQRSNRDDVLRLPEWFSKNSLYFSGKVFKKRMQLDAGFDFRINSEFRPDGYQPVLAQFHLQDTLRQQPYPWLDVFAAFKVQTLRVFVRYENASTLWDKTSVFYQTARYPQPFGAIRLGVTWRFLDSNQRDPNDAPTTAPNGAQPPSGLPTGRGGRG